MKDPYHLLNITRHADKEAIKQAYRKLAKKLHPDQNPGDQEAEQRFKDITQAYTLLSDDKARRAYDRGRINTFGQNGQATAGGYDVGWWRKGIGAMLDRLWVKFGHAMRDREKGDTKPSSRSQAAGQRSQSGQSKSGDGPDEQHLRLEVDFCTAVLGGKQRMTRADGKTLEIDIPPGTNDNTMLRLRGQGSGGMDKPCEALLIHIQVLDHPVFTRRGQDLYLDLPVSLKEAFFGAKIRTPTIEGAVSLNIPAKANSGQLLRLKGKGAEDRSGRRGDQYVRLMVMLPKAPSAAMEADLERLASYDDEQVRAHLDVY